MGEKMLPGELDRRFKVRAPLRCDGVGSLDCAEDTESGVRMAIRWLPVDANGEEAVKAVQQMPRHPVLPRIRQTGRIGSAAYVAMEFPEGRLLSTMLHAPLLQDDVARIGAAVADALSTLHADGVVHGELSCDSVLCLPEGRSILWDAPLVMANRLTDRRGEERTLALLIRHAPFLAPERARGLPSSAPSDVYALGALMCLAAGGQPPPGGNTLAVLHQIANRQWTPEIPRALTGALRMLVGRMISPDPLARPTAREVAEVLTDGLHASPTVLEMKAVMTPTVVPVARPAAPDTHPVTPPPARTATPTIVSQAPSELDALPSIVLEPELEAEVEALRSSRRLRMVLTGGAALVALVCIVLVAGLTLAGNGSPANSAAPASDDAADSAQAVAVAGTVNKKKALVPPVVIVPAGAGPTAADVAGLVSPLVGEVAQAGEIAKKSKTNAAKSATKPRSASGVPARNPAPAAMSSSAPVAPAPRAEPAPTLSVDDIVPAVQPPASATDELKRPKF